MADTERLRGLVSLLPGSQRMIYVIYSRTATVTNDFEPMFWSNTWGWGSLKGAKRYPGKKYNLPLEGEWMTLKEAQERTREWRNGLTKTRKKE